MNGFLFFVAVVGVVIVLTSLFARQNETADAEDPTVTIIRDTLADECPFLGQRTIDRLAGDIAAALSNHQE
jgi:hypothetical protein